MTFSRCQSANSVNSPSTFGQTSVLQERASLKRISEALLFGIHSGYFLKFNLIINDVKASALQPVHRLQQ
jgi:hypothetical protein